MKLNGLRTWSKYRLAAAAGLLVVGAFVVRSVPANTSNHDTPRKAVASVRGSIAKTPVARARSKGGSAPSTAARMLFMGGPSRARWNSMNDLFLSADEASKRLGFDLKMPKSPAVGKLYGIFVPKDARDEATIVYGDHDGPTETETLHVHGQGITIDVQKLDHTYDPKPFHDAMVAAKQRGDLKSNNVPFSIDVNGAPGSGWEPGYNLIRGEKLPKLGSLSWEDNGVLYTVSGTSGEDGTSVKELLEIARSISE